MSENNKDQSFIEKLKNMKVNRASIITAVVLVAAVAVIVSVTVVSNRTKDKTDVPEDTKKPSVSDTDTPDTPKDTDKPEPETDKPQGNNKPTVSRPVEDKLPSFILPVSGTLSKEHDPKVQVYSSTLKDYRVHLGVDIVTSEGASVFSAADGTVAKVWKDDMMGYSIAIKHSGDSYTFYQNLSDTLPESITVGATVRTGQLIGTVGDSAMTEVAEEPHLHFEMTVADLSVDPLEYFSEDALKSLTIDASYE